MKKEKTFKPAVLKKPKNNHTDLNKILLSNCPANKEGCRAAAKCFHCPCT